MTTITTTAIVRTPAESRGMPRGARWAAMAFVALLQWFEGWRREVAATTTQSKAEREANALRAYADELALTDRRAAEDLYAAADRHERGE